MKTGELIPTQYKYEDDFLANNIDAVSFNRRVSPYYQGVKWAVLRGPLALNNEGEWEFEPMPSNRDDEYYKRCRYDTLDDAIAAYENRKPDIQLKHETKTKKETKRKQ